MVYMGYNGGYSGFYGLYGDYHFYGLFRYHELVFMGVIVVHKPTYNWGAHPEWKCSFNGLVFLGTS